MKNYRIFGRILAVLLILAMLMPNISMPAASKDLPCAEDGCSGKYGNGICSVDASHLEAPTLEDGIYRIGNAGQLYWFAALVNAGENEYQAGDNGDVYNAVLTGDITLSAEENWTPIGLYNGAREYIRYSGTFDGAGHTISGLRYDNTTYTGRTVGFIGCLDSNGTVKNLTLANCAISGATDVGGIVSHNYGTVSGCVQLGSVSGTGTTGGIVSRNMDGGRVDDCVNNGTVSGAVTGGIAGENAGSIVECRNGGAVSGTNSVGGIVGINSNSVGYCVNSADVSADNTHVGGIAGNHVGGEIVWCGNTGAVSGGSDYIGGVAGVCSGAAIYASYNTGSVTGAGQSDAVGGVAGAIDGTNLTAASIASCCNTGDVSGRSWVGGIAGVSGYQKTPQTVEISNGYHTGTVAGTSYSGAVVGSLTKGTVSDIYYLQGGQNSVSGASAATAEQFASGEIAYSLNGSAEPVWYQNLDLENAAPDASPLPDPTHGTVYYGYRTCTEMGYTNREDFDVPAHDYVGGVCTECGEEDPDYVPEVEVIASGWSGYTTWVLTSDGTLTFSPTGQKYEDGQCNLRNYWKVNGVLTLPWGEYADQITKVVIEDGIHDIGQMAFYELPNLEVVELGADVIEIRNYAFKNCAALTTINLEGVEFIREGAFYGCASLTEVTLAEGVTIGDWAFTKSGVTLN